MSDLTINAKTGGDFTVGSIAFAPTQVRAAELVVAGTITALQIEPSTKGFGIGRAVEALRAGRRVARAGWNGKGMQLELQVPDAHSKMTQPYAYLVTLAGDRVPWTCSQSDLLALDWEIVS